jgi:hypothetical protein
VKKPQALIGLLAALGTAIGVLVAVIGLPYGRANYTAFADLYHDGGTPAIGLIDVAVDCDTTNGAIVDSDCNIALPAASTQVGITIGNNTASASSIGSMNFRVLHPTADLDAVNENPPAQPANDSNPEENDEGVPGLGNLGCTPPDPDEDLGGNPPGEDSFLSCFTGSANGPALPNDSVHITVAFVDYAITGGATIGETEPVTVADVAFSDNALNEIGSCNPVIDVAAACFGAEIHFVAPPPTNTPAPTDTPEPPTVTNTPAPTNTPVPGINVVKVPECDDGVPSADDVASATDNSDDTDVTANDNCDLSDPDDPEANLWICEVGPCDDAGEGSLHVLENASPVVGTVGAYEFQVEYDNFVISSVNPCDVFFGPANGTAGPGEGDERGPVDEVNASSPANADCTPDPGGASNGTCAISLLQENSVRFGCVTTGLTPTVHDGNITLASLELVPHEDLKQDLFPGNENGVVTIVKDNGCEIADELGHPVAGTVNGGLTPVCGDLAVTVRILEGDIDLDCDVDVADAQIIATKYGSFFGSLLYSKWLDLEPARHDLDIDIKDLQKVFGRIGSACQEPVPPQPPVSFP